MGMTMTQKILAKHAGLESVRAGQLIQAKLDLVLGNDITTPVAINEFESAGFEKVFDKSRIAMVMDHFAPNKDIKSATQCKQCRTFARRFDIDHFYDVGTMGIEHALLPEQGLVAPGEAVIGADSHTCTYGALGAFSTGVGSTDMGAAMAAGETWFKVPSAIKVNLTGKLRPFVSGKDVILTLIGMIGVDGARYQSIEFAGEGVKNLTIYDRLTICNMAIEAGGKNGIFPVDDVTRAYVEGRVDRPWTAFEADPDAEYERVIDIDLGKVDCTVAWPHLPENAHSAREGSDIAIDQIVIGSCTNGQLPDMAAAAAILKGHHLAPNVRGIIIPATQEVYRACMHEGYDDIFEEVFTGYVSKPYNGGGFTDEVTLKDEMLLLEETQINDTFLDTTPQEMISYFLGKAGVSKMKLSSQGYPKRKRLPIRQMSVIEAINAVHAAWNTKQPFFFSGGVFYWGEKPEQSKIYTFEYGVNIISLVRTGGAWELETVSAPFVRHSHKINVIHPKVSGEFEVSKVVSSTGENGFIRTKIYF